MSPRHFNDDIDFQYASPATWALLAYLICFPAIEKPSQAIYGVQFHPEVDLTPNGATILKNFLYTIAGLHGTYQLKSREEMCIKYIKDTVKDHKVLVCDISYTIDTTCISGTCSPHCAATVN